MIKFQCDACQKKIGVPDTYAGKHVRCPQCRGPALVPPPQTEPLPEVDTIWTDDILNSQRPSGVSSSSAGVRSPGGMAVASRAPRGSQVNCSHCGVAVSAESDFCVQCGSPLQTRPAPIAVSEDGAGILGWFKGIASFPLAVGAGFGAALLGALVWAKIVCVIDREFGIVAWGIGVLIGIIMAALANRQGVFLGVLAAFFAIFSIVMGKVFIAKWYVMPLMEKQYRATIEEMIKETVDDPQALFAAACEYYAHQGVIDKARVEEAVSLYQDGVEPRKETADKVYDAKEKVEAKLKGMSRVEKENMVREQYNQMENDIAAQAEVHSALRKIGFFIAFLACFSLFDILWVALAVGSAYKIAAGNG